MTIIPGRARLSLLMGVVAAGAILAAPMASADDPDEQCAQQAPPSSDQQQQCDQQQQGLGMPKIPDNRNSNNGSPQQPQQAPQQPQQAPQRNPQQGIDFADKNCWVVNGVPTMWTPALTTGPGDVVQWCPTVYGLKPH